MVKNSMLVIVYSLFCYFSILVLLFLFLLEQTLYSRYNKENKYEMEKGDCYAKNIKIYEKGN